MGFFDFFRQKKDVVDLSENATDEEEEESKVEQSSEQEDSADISNIPIEKKKRLAKRIATISEKIDDLSNDVYHLQQRMEVLEKRLGNDRDLE